MNRLAALLLWLLLGVATAGGMARPAHAQPAPPAPTSDRAPDPRRGERLDGRPVPADPKRRLRAVGRAVLAVPRWLIEGLLWPVVRVASFVESRHLVARTYWALTSEDRLVGLRPEAHYETGLLSSIGVRYFDRRALGRGSLVQLRGRSAGRDYVFLEMRLRPPPRGPFAVAYRGMYERTTGRMFAGMDGETRAELLAAGRGLASFGMDRALNGLNLEWQAASPLLLSLGGELDLRRYRSTASIDALYCAEPGTPSCTGVDDRLVPGFNEGLRLARARAGLVFDTRDGHRLGGLRVALDGALAHGLVGDPSVHFRAVADARLVLDLSDRALIMRANAGLVKPMRDAPVPFEELMSPGGTDGLRGVSWGRLRDHSQLFGSLEYRWLVAPYLDAALFVDHGGVFDRGFAGVSLDRMIPSYGFGLRIHEIRGDYWNADPILRLQIAHAPGEGTRLMVSLGAGD
jgi:hypothetical protein